jgi:ABC-2 type transport system permease protein
MATTTTTPTADAPATPPEPTGKPSGSLWGAVLASETTKLRTVRSTVWTLFATLVVTIGIGSLIALARTSRWDNLSLHDRLTFDPTNFSLRGVFLAQLAIGVLGVLIVSSEYSSGMIRTTFAAVPQRRVVLYSKAIVFAIVAYVTTAIACLAAFLIGQAIFAGKRLPTGAVLGVSLSSPGALRSVLLAAFYLTVVGIIGLALGSLLRRTAGAIATLFGIVFVLPILTSALPSPWDTDVGKYLPSGAGVATFTVKHTSDLLHPGAGLLVLVGYVIFALWLAGFALTRRDA